MLQMDFALTPFRPVPEIDTASVALEISHGRLSATWLIRGELDAISVPPVAAESRRITGLWEHTCVEIFLREAFDSCYHELNLSPSGDWQCFSFSDLRAGRRESGAVVPVSFERDLTRDSLEIRATFALQPVIARPVIGLSTVIETGDHLHYFALAHGERPDFHDPAYHQELQP